MWTRLWMRSPTGWAAPPCSSALAALHDREPFLPVALRSRSGSAVASSRTSPVASAASTSGAMAYPHANSSRHIPERVLDAGCPRDSPLLNVTAARPDDVLLSW